MIPGGASRLTFRRIFPRAMRLVLTFVAVSLVGFYGAAEAARRTESAWPFRRLPLFFNPAPEDVRSRALAALRVASEPDGPAALAARNELLRLGGAALPHVLPRLDSLEPNARGRVALALGPVALRMRVAAVDDVATPERALLFFSRFWQDRSIEFRAATVRRAVQRLAERSLTLRRDDVLHADTYALEALVSALGQVETRADVERIARLHPVLVNITSRGQALSAAPTLAEAARAVEGWQRLWLEEGADYTVLEGPRRVASLVTETQLGKWLAQAFLWHLGRAQDGSHVFERVLTALPETASHVVFLLALALALAAASSLVAGPAGLAQRARLRVATTAASLVASYPLVLTLALALELRGGQPGVLELCAESLRKGDVNLAMGALLGITALSEVLVTIPVRLSRAPFESREEGE